MSRREALIEERGEPSLAYLRRANAGAPIELCIVEKDRTTIWTLSDEKVLRMIAEGSNFLWTRPKA